MRNACAWTIAEAARVARAAQFASTNTRRAIYSRVSRLGDIVCLPLRAIQKTRRMKKGTKISAVSFVAAISFPLTELHALCQGLPDKRTFPLTRGSPLDRTLIAVDEQSGACATLQRKWLANTGTHIACSLSSSSFFPRIFSKSCLNHTKFLKL